MDLLIRLIIAVLAGLIAQWVVAMFVEDRRISALAGLLVGLLFFFGHVNMLQ